MTQKYAKFILEKNKKDYDIIAPVYLETRSIITDDIKEVATYAKSGDKILDWGCGFGRLTELFAKKRVQYLGVDVSKTLIKLAKSRYPKYQFIQVPYFSLPFPDNFFTKIYCLAVFHHIPGQEYRIKFLQEAKRLLRNNGMLILTVWVIPNNIQYKTNLNLDPQDVLVPFKNSQGKTLANRYFHKFNIQELKELFKKVGFKILKTGKLTRGKYENLLIIGKK